MTAVRERKRIDLKKDEQYITRSPNSVEKSALGCRIYTCVRGVTGMCHDNEGGTRMYKREQKQVIVS